MSRTYRKPLRMLEENVENYIKRHIGEDKCHENSFLKKRITIRKTDEEYNADYAAALRKEEIRYQKEIQTALYDYPCMAGYHYVPAPRWSKDGKPVKKYVQRANVYVSHFHCRYEDISYDAYLKEHRAQYAKFSRDGHWNETGRNTGFKKGCTKQLRIDNRKLEYDILVDRDYDHKPYPDTHDYDKMIWDYW